jgi:cobalt-zinc-cadmium efflux system protein
MLNSTDSTTVKKNRYYHQNCSCYIHFHSNTANTIEQTKKVRLLWTILFLVSGFAFVELIVSRWSHSLVLLADSSHMFSDALALGIALLGTHLTKLPVFNRTPFLQKRAEALAALVNGISLVAIALWIVGEAFIRWLSPDTEIFSLPMLIVAVVGLGVNVINIALLHDSSHSDLNIKSAFLHVVADAVSSIGTILAAIALYLLHWTWADGFISILVSFVILISVIPLVSQSLDILCQETPNQLAEDISSGTAQNVLEDVSSLILKSKTYTLDDLIPQSPSNIL